MEEMKIQPALIFYDVAKKEMLLRIREREVALYVWLGILGTIFTISFHSAPPNYSILLILPLLSAGISMRISQHETLIAKLAHYCKTEVGPCLKRNAPEGLRHWDESESLKGQKSIVGLRNVVNAILIVGPCLIAIYLNFGEFKSSEFPFQFSWILSCIFTSYSAYSVFKSTIDRLREALKFFDEGTY